MAWLFLSHFDGHRELVRLGEPYRNIGIGNTFPSPFSIHFVLPQFAFYFFLSHFYEKEPRSKGRKKKTYKTILKFPIMLVG